MYSDLLTSLGSIPNLIFPINSLSIIFEYMVFLDLFNFLVDIILPFIIAILIPFANSMDRPAFPKVSIFMDDSNDRALLCIQKSCSSDHIETSQFTIVNSNNVDLPVVFWKNPNISTSQSSISFPINQIGRLIGSGKDISLVDLKVSWGFL